MPFHHGLERKKFDARQRALRRKYQRAGMPEPDIQSLYRHDLSEFLDERRHREHTQPLSEAGVCMNDRSESFSRYMWVEEISNPALTQRLKGLTQTDLELLTLYAIEGYTQAEIAAFRGMTRQAVSKRIRVLKSFLKFF